MGRRGKTTAALLLGALGVVLTIHGFGSGAAPSGGPSSGDPSSGGPASGSPASGDLTAGDRDVPVPAAAQQAVVRRHVDGDTVVLAGIGGQSAATRDGAPLPAGSSATVRLLEVDTPEVYRRSDCYGGQASAFTERLLPVGAVVFVTADRERRDRYGRMLLYLWTESGVFVQEALVHYGYARAVLYPPNDRYIALLREVARDARARHWGVWSCHVLPVRFRAADTS